MTRMCRFKCINARIERVEHTVLIERERLSTQFERDDFEQSIYIARTLIQEMVEVAGEDEQELAAEMAAQFLNEELPGTAILIFTAILQSLWKVSVNSCGGT